MAVKGAQETITNHNIFPNMGAVTVFLRKPEDVMRAIELLRLSYHLALQQQARYKAKK